MDNIGGARVVRLTAEIVSAYVTNNRVPGSELTKLIEGVHIALVRAPAAIVEPVEQQFVPAVAIKKSVTPDFIISLEDGKKFKSLKRHLKSTYDLTPEEYRAKWGLPHDYPMVAPNYSKARSDFAKKMGLGRKNGAESPANKARPRKRSNKQAA